MNKGGPIIVIEDDEDDQHILAQIFGTLNYSNDIVFFKDGEAALKYLEDDTIYPFIIISDVNLPKLNGFELRKVVQTNEGLRAKCIPYIFFSTSVERKAVCDAYALSVQGIFLKQPSYNKLLNTLRVIVAYWQECYAPNNYETIS